MNRVFDLEKARAGAEVQTTDGRKVEILKFDRKGQGGTIDMIALVTTHNIERQYSYAQDGTVLRAPKNLNLVMKPSTVHLWMLVYRGSKTVYSDELFSSYTDAEQAKKEEEAQNVLGELVIASVTWED